MQRFPHLLLRFRGTQASSGKSLLATLRGETGFPIRKCKEALTLHNNDLKAAEEWLHSRAKEEGWAKAQKLRAREARHGLIGVLVRENRAAMVELNCETDFVARNDIFKSLVSMTTQAVLEHKSPDLLTPGHLPSVDHFTTNSILSIRQEPLGEIPLADLVAETIGQLSENIAVPRGCIMNAANGTVYSFAYKNISPSDTPVAMGTYAALVHLLPSGKGGVPSDSQQALGTKLCQHVIGVCPKAVYPGGDVDKSEALVEQNFIFDESCKVGDVLRESGVQVTGFVRFGLGETQEG